MGLRIALLGMDKVREFGGIAKEEDGSVVEDPVKIAFVGADLDGKATGIAGSVRRTRLATDCRETNGSTGSVADLFEEGGAGEVGNVVRHLKVAMRASTLSVDLNNSKYEWYSNRLEVL